MFFVFDYIHDSATMHNLTQDFSTEPKNACVGRWCGDVFADMLKSANVLIFLL